MKPPVLYLAHPVAATPEQIERKRFETDPSYHHRLTESCIDDNLESALAWLGWLVKHTDWAISMPWWPYVKALGEDGADLRERGLRDDCAMAERCDGIILVGGRISSGMQRELDAVRAAGGRVIDLTYLGPTPPEPHTDTWWRVIGKLKDIDFILTQERVGIGIGKL